MKVIKHKEWMSLPEQAQQEVYDFFLFVKQRYEKKDSRARSSQAETLLFSNHSASLVMEWFDDAEDEVWK